MKVRSGGPTCRAFESDGRAARHDVAAPQPRRVAGRVPVVRRISVAVEHHKQVAVADAAGVEVDDPGVRRHDVGSVWSRDVEAGMNLVRPWAVGIRHLEIERRAAEALTDAPRSARRLWPLEDTGTAACLRPGGLVLHRELRHLSVRRRALLPYRPLFPCA